MANGSEFAAIGFGVLSAAFWGAGDFSGGLATKRANVFGVVMVSQIIGLALILVIAILSAEPIPPPGSLIWAAAAGISGAVGIVSFWRALAAGQMRIAAPVTAVFTALVPGIVGALTEKLPSPIQFVGLRLALVRVWVL